MKVLVLLLLALFSCSDESVDSALHVDLNLPGHFPQPLVPSENPLTAESIELGRHLFYDTRLSGNETISCSSCHKQEFAFADNRSVSPGATNELGTLNAPSLANVIYSRPLTWSRSGVLHIEDQLLGPMFGESPIEMGMAGSSETILARLKSDQYLSLFEAAFPGQVPTMDLVRFALASFVRSLVSYQAPFDDFIAGDLSAISENARLGSELFYSSRLGCTNCHAGFAFSNATLSSNTSGTPATPYHNIGLYNLDGQGAYPSSARGRIEDSGIAKDMGRFRVPSLRNVALSAPYGHDGSVATLEEFIRIYEAGGREIVSGPWTGDGRTSPWRSPVLKSFTLTDPEREHLLAFLESLSDQVLVSSEEVSNPW